MGGEGSPRQKARKFAFRLGVKMFSSAFVSFTLVFVTAASVGLVIELLPWIFRTGVTDIDPLPILIVSFILGFAAMYARYLIMKRFSRITP